MPQLKLELGSTPVHLPTSCELRVGRRLSGDGVQLQQQHATASCCWCACAAAAAGLVVVVDFLLFYILAHTHYVQSPTHTHIGVQEVKFWSRAHNVNKDMRSACPFPQQEKCSAGNAIAN